MVRLKEMKKLIEEFTDKSFNSLMVRLKAKSAVAFHNTFSSFQFLDGAIKSSPCDLFERFDIFVSIP